jgi:hypothetical protein
MYYKIYVPAEKHSDENEIRHAIKSDKGGHKNGGSIQTRTV